MCNAIVCRLEVENSPDERSRKRQRCGRELDENNDRQLVALDISDASNPNSAPSNVSSPAQSKRVEPEFRSRRPVNSAPSTRVPIRVYWCILE